MAERANKHHLPTVILICVQLCIVLVFFLPWLQMEIVPVDGYILPELAKEKYGRDSVMAILIYVLYALPVSAIVAAWSLIFDYKFKLRLVFSLQVAIAAITVAMLFQFHFDEVMNIRIREGALLGLFLAVFSLLFPGKRVKSTTS